MSTRGDPHASVATAPMGVRVAAALSSPNALTAADDYGREMGDSLGTPRDESYVSSQQREVSEGWDNQIRPGMTTGILPVRLSTSVRRRESSY